MAESTGLPQQEVNNDKEMQMKNKSKVYQSNSLNDITNKDIELNSILSIENKKKQKNKMGNHKTNISVQNYSRAKFLSSSVEKNEHNISCDMILSNSVILQYKDVSHTKREKNDYIKRVAIFTNRINALKKQENELSNRMSVFQKKEKLIEQIKQSKMKLKEYLNKTKTDLRHQKETKKEQVMLRKLEELNQLEKTKREQKEKKKKSTDSCKAHQSLMKCMKSQSTTKAETLNKYKYLQIKEGYAQYQTEEFYKNKEKKKQKDSSIIKKINEDKEVIMTLKEKCNELEKMEENCFERLKTTKIQSKYFQDKADPSYSLNNKIKVHSSGTSSYAMLANQLVSDNKKSNDKDNMNSKGKDCLLNDHNMDQLKEKPSGGMNYNERLIDITKKNVIKPKQRNGIIQKRASSSLSNQKKMKQAIAHLNNDRFNSNKTNKNSVDEKTISKTKELSRPSSQIKRSKQHKSNSTKTSTNTSLVINQRNAIEIYPLSSSELKYSTII